MKKFDYEDYKKFCEERDLEESDEKSLTAYKEVKDKEENENEVAQKVEEQKAVFDAISKYMKKDVEYNEDAFDFINRIFDSMLYAVKMATIVFDSMDNIDKVNEDFGMN